MSDTEHVSSVFLQCIGNETFFVELPKELAKQDPANQLLFQWHRNLRPKRQQCLGMLLVSDTCIMGIHLERNLHIFQAWGLCNFHSAVNVDLTVYSLIICSISLLREVKQRRWSVKLGILKRKPKIVIACPIWKGVIAATCRSSKHAWTQNCRCTMNKASGKPQGTTLDEELFGSSVRSHKWLFLSPGPILLHLRIFSLSEYLRKIGIVRRTMNIGGMFYGLSS